MRALTPHIYTPYVPLFTLQRQDQLQRKPHYARPWPHVASLIRLYARLPMNARPFSRLDARGKQAAFKRYVTTEALRYALDQGQTFSEALRALTDAVTTWLFTELGERIV